MIWSSPRTVAALVAGALVQFPTAGARAQSMLGDDVSPAIVVHQGDDIEVTIGGLLQLHAAPYVGNDALLDDDDPAAREGLRLRRARFGFAAALPDDVGFLLVLDPLESEPDMGAISDARISYTPRRWLRLSAGADKVPFTRGELQSSAALATIERPLSVDTLVPQNRLGAMVEGAVGAGVSYVAGVMNATEGYTLGNRFSGLLYVGRVELAAARGGLVLAAGAGGYFEEGPATNTLAASADLRIGMAGASLLVEALCDRTTPDDSPQTSPGVSDELERCGAYAEASYRTRGPRQTEVEPVVRVEVLDDNRGLDDAGDALLVSAGANARINPHLRLQLHYLGRFERESDERANDTVILAVQGEL